MLCMVCGSMLPTSASGLQTAPRARQERVPGQKSAPAAGEQQGAAKASRVSGPARKAVTWADSQAVEGYVPRARARTAPGAVQGAAPVPAGCPHADSAAAGAAGPSIASAGPSMRGIAAGPGSGCQAGNAAESAAGAGATPSTAEGASQPQGGCNAESLRDALAPAAAGALAVRSGQDGSAAADTVGGAPRGEQTGGEAVLLFEMQDPAGPLDAGEGELGARFGELKVRALCERALLLIVPCWAPAGVATRVRRSRGSALTCTGVDRAGGARGRAGPGAGAAAAAAGRARLGRADRRDGSRAGAVARAPGRAPGDEAGSALPACVQQGCRVSPCLLMQALAWQGRLNE